MPKMNKIFTGRKLIQVKYARRTKLQKFNALTQVFVQGCVKVQYFSIKLKQLKILCLN